MAKLKYISAENLAEIVEIIQSFNYISKEEVPQYDDEPDRIDDYFELIERLKNDTYYPDIYSKASALFLNINAHLFFNGNKRLAVFSLTFFLENNGFHPIPLTKKDYSKLLQDCFGKHTLDDFEIFSPTDFAMYNLALITARYNEEGKSFDDIKLQTQSFLKHTFQSTL
ncbi:TPA: hypothetical protein DEP58_03240 [Patescibacteria group bacterium]|nr:MAG: hypothetical protein UU98_C0028G0013 [Parcubacteria group bacterium GW2011_GWD2_42_14]HCC05294.1 hypothetical protein [Patescibacteria group bacterium]